MYCIYYRSKKATISNNATITNTVTITRKKNIITSNNQGNYNFVSGVTYKLIYIGASGLNNNQMRVAYIKTTSSGNTAYYQIVGGNITNAGDETGVPRSTPLPLWEIEDGYDESGFASGGCISNQRLMLIGPGLKGSRLAEYSDFGIYEESISQTSPVSVYPFKTSDNKFTSILSVDSVIYGFTLNELYRFVKSTSSADTSINFSSAKIDMKYGCSELTPLSINSFLVYLDKSKNKLNVGYYESQKELLYTDEITKTNSAILDGNVKTYIYQQNPNDLIWLLKNDGKIVIIKYNDMQQNITYGGIMQYSMNDGTIKDIVSIPNTSGKDQIYFAVLRNINGQDVLYYEKFNDYINLHQDTYASDYLDCAVTLNAPFTTTEISGEIYVSGFDRLKGKDVYVVFDKSNIRQKRQVDSLGRIKLTQIDTIAFNTYQSITCGLEYDTSIKISPVDVFFDGRYSTTGERVDIVDTRIIYQNSILCDIYDRLGNLAMSGRSLNNDDILSIEESFVFEYKQRIIGGKTKRNTFFSLKVKDGLPLPCNILGIEYYAEF